MFSWQTLITLLLPVVFNDTHWRQLLMHASLLCYPLGFHVFHVCLLFCIGLNCQVITKYHQQL